MDLVNKPGRESVLSLSGAPVNQSLRFSSFGLEFPPGASVMAQKLKLQPTATKHWRKVYVFNPVGQKSELFYFDLTAARRLNA